MKKHILIITCALLAFSCVEDADHEAIDTSITNPDLEGKTELTFQELYNLHSNEIGKDTLVTGYVVSTDVEGNTYKEIYVQNTLEATDIAADNPRMGLRVRLGLRSTGIKYVQGRKISINLEGLKRTTSDNLLTIGAPDNNYIKDIIEFDVDNHILKYNKIGEIIPKTVKISELQIQDLNTLVNIQNLQFSSYEFGKPLSGLPIDAYDGKRTLESCNNFTKDTIILETSNFASFSVKDIPESKVNISAIYSINFNDEPILILNQFEELEITTQAHQECEITTPDLFITEVADPLKETKARFVEIYNPTKNSVSLKGWNLVRYNYTTSKNTKEQASLSISLDGFTIPANDFIIVARDETAFSTYFENIGNVFSSNLDGNGDDAYELISPYDEIIDVYGDSNIDGSDSDWEYTDGFAKRNISINTPSRTFNISEWEVKQNQESSSSFSPRVR